MKTDYFFSRYLEEWREFSTYLYTDYCFEGDKGGDTLVLLEYAAGIATSNQVIFVWNKPGLF